MRFLPAAIGVLVALTGCDPTDDSDTQLQAQADCTTCHASEEALVATADPVEDDGGGGSGEG